MNRSGKDVAMEDYLRRVRFSVKKRQRIHNDCRQGKKNYSGVDSWPEKDQMWLAKDRQLLSDMRKALNLSRQEHEKIMAEEAEKIRKRKEGPPV